MRQTQEMNRNPNTGRAAMKMRRSRDPAGRRIGRLALLMMVLTAVVVAGACNEMNKLLTSETPKLIPANGLATPENADLLVNSAIGDFECAYGAYVALTAELSHEMVDATQTAARWPYDRRDVKSSDLLYGTYTCESLGIYVPLSTARWSSENILGHLQQWTDQQVPDRQKLMAEAAAYAGYSYVLFGEGFCQAAINLSPAMGSQELLDSAVVRFTTALAAAQASSDQDMANFAHVGRARAYLDLGQDQQALADAQQVSPGFVWNMSASSGSSRSFNRVFAQNGNPPAGGDAMSVGPQYRDLTYDGVADPRVPVVNGGYNSTTGIPIYFQQKYTSQSSPIAIASYDEAQLIIAEVQGGQTAVDIINTFHQAAGLPPFNSTDPATIKAHVIQERDRVLWLTGHRFYDIRRLSLPLVPAPGTAYPAGSTYGNTVCLPLPDIERDNNPNIP